LGLKFDARCGAGILQGVLRVRVGLRDLRGIHQEHHAVLRVLAAVLAAAAQVLDVREAQPAARHSCVYNGRDITQWKQRHAAGDAHVNSLSPDRNTR
jgi:hypothetical protein